VRRADARSGVIHTHDAHSALCQRCRVTGARLLLDKWAALLADAAVAASGAEVAAAHSPLLFLAASPSALLIVAPHLRRAVPAVLDALTLTLTDNPGAHDVVAQPRYQHTVTVSRC